MPSSTRGINSERLLEDGVGGDSEVPTTATPPGLVRLQMGRKLCRIILVVLLMIDLVTSVMLVGAAYEFDLPSVFESYALRSSLVDSLAISAARVVALSTQSWLGWWVGFASGVLAISKAMVYSHESEPVAANALIFFAVAMAVVELLLCSRCMALSRRCAAVHELSSKATTSPDAEKASYETKLQLLLHPPPSSIRGTMKILQPYFWPAGIVNKLRTFATFLIMGGSKACTECRRITAGVPPDCHRIAI